MRFDRFAPQVLSVLWIVAALLFFRRGPQNLFGFPASPYPPAAVFSTYGAAAILACLVPLYLVFAGPGPWSLDARKR